MKTTLLLLATLSLATAGLAALPAAEARGFCVAGVDPWCPGIACTYNSKTRHWDCIPRDVIVCVREPCPFGIERLLP